MLFIAWSSAVTIQRISVCQLPEYYAYVWQNAIIIFLNSFIFFFLSPSLSISSPLHANLVATFLKVNTGDAVLWLPVRRRFILYFFSPKYFYVHIHSKTKREWQIFALDKFAIFFFFFYLTLEFRSDDSVWNLAISANVCEWREKCVSFQ